MSKFCAHGGIRTPTLMKAPPPQDGVSTNFTTCARMHVKLQVAVVIANEHVQVAA